MWARISFCGTIKLMFMGTFTATWHINILEATLIPFVDEVYPDGHSKTITLNTLLTSTLALLSRQNALTL